ncbi:MAG: stage II sporulation protein M [Planctomycetes bacterium]|nr:stage II sporulation protein M [Planctomycetota bacterium]
MKREPFVAAREARWKALEQLLESLAKPKLRRAEHADVAQFPRWYRQVCQDLALARRRMYGRELALRLNHIALAGRDQLYKAPVRTLAEVTEFAARGFPRLVRSEAKLLWVSTAVFLVPALIVGSIAMVRPDLLYAIVDIESLQEAERMYDPDSRTIEDARDASGNVAMFAFYVKHNVGIDFQIFAGGLPFGLGSILFLALNGVHLGAIVGHFLTIGYERTLFPFVVGHSSFELTAMLIAGVAGLRLGAVLVAPGRRSRRRALIDIGPHCLKLALGAGAMTVLAAFIEGFWSAQPLPPSVKYAVGAVLWSLVVVYLVFAGRSGESRTR